MAALIAYRAVKSLSYEAISKRIYEWFLKDMENQDRYLPYLRDEIQFDIDEKLIGRVVSEEHIPSPQFCKAIFLWLRSDDYGNDLLKDKRREEELISKESTVLSIRRAFGLISNLRSVRVNQWVGEYALYRPFHLAPRSQMQVSRFRIGSQESEFDCEMESHLTYLGQEQINIGSGKLAPLDADRAVAIMALNQKVYSPGLLKDEPPDGSYTLHLCDPQKAGGQIIAFGGLMVASVGPISAWPIFAIRTATEAPVKPHVLSDAEHLSLDEHVRVQMDRGAIYWQEKDFPKPLRS